MAEYIEREALLNAARHNKAIGRGEADIMDIQSLVYSVLAAADVAPVRHGHWINKNSPYDYNIYICSVCRKQVSICGNKLLYCPNCSARMDEEV